MQNLKDFHYSIIIPHKNIPDLLSRCLASIPCRDDVQVLIVDDNSDPSMVDFERFPGMDRANTEIYFTKEGKGAGYARNVGLDHAKGKWLIFADSDDFFTPVFSELLDKYLDYQEDIIFFEHNSVLCDDITTPAVRDIHADVRQYINEDGFLRDEIRWNACVVWARIYSREFVQKNDIRFQELRWSNDLGFQAQAGVLAKSVFAANEVLYTVTVRHNSLASLTNVEKPKEELICRTKAALDMYSLVNSNGYQETDFPIAMPLLRAVVFRRDFFLLIRLLRYTDSNIRDTLFRRLCSEGHILRRMVLRLCCLLASI